MPVIKAVILSIFFVLLSWADAGHALSAGPVSPPDRLPETEPSGAPSSLLDQRLQQERQSRGARFSILPHKPNYLLPVSYNTSPNDGTSAGLAEGDKKLDNLEVKFQLSIKIPVLSNIFGNNDTLYLAYSQLSLWQAYNFGYSSPFRETNYEPEIFLGFRTDYELMGMNCQAMTVGFNHQSNGRPNPFSRSWNRIVANMACSAGGESYIILRPWLRIPDFTADDDNRQMDKYYGYGELTFLQKYREHTLTLMLRNNLRVHDNKGAVQLDWSFPLHKKIKGYVQYFAGYGESLIDYDHASNVLGVGVMLTDWL